MDKQSAIRYFIRFAKENARAARKLGKSDSLGAWYKGRACAYLTAARLLSGAAPARDRNMLRRAA